MADLDEFDEAERAFENQPEPRCRYRLLRRIPSRSSESSQYIPTLHGGSSMQAAAHADCKLSMIAEVQGGMHHRRNAGCGCGRHGSRRSQVLAKSLHSEVRSRDFNPGTTISLQLLVFVHPERSAELVESNLHSFPMPHVCVMKDSTPQSRR